MNPALCRVFTYNPCPAFRRQASLNCWCPSFPMASVNCDSTLPIRGIQFFSGRFSLVFRCICVFMYPSPSLFKKPPSPLFVKVSQICSLSSVWATSLCKSLKARGQQGSVEALTVSPLWPSSQGTPVQEFAIRQLLCPREGAHSGNENSYWLSSGPSSSRTTFLGHSK